MKSPKKIRKPFDELCNTCVQYKPEGKMICNQFCQGTTYVVDSVKKFKSLNNE